MKTEEKISTNTSRVRIVVLGMISVGKSGNYLIIIFLKYNKRIT